eukprot:SAG22_NODE_20803_length_262_cov_1.073620_2_plen_39_part_01
MRAGLMLGEQASASCKAACGYMWCIDRRTDLAVVGVLRV